MVGGQQLRQRVRAPCSVVCPGNETCRPRKGGTWRSFYCPTLRCQSTQALRRIGPRPGYRCGKGIIRCFRTHSGIEPPRQERKNRHLRCRIKIEFICFLIGTCGRQMPTLARESRHIVAFLSLGTTSRAVLILDCLRCGVNARSLFKQPARAKGFCQQGFWKVRKRDARPGMADARSKGRLR